MDHRRSAKTAMFVYLTTSFPSFAVKKHKVSILHFPWHPAGSGSTFKGKFTTMVTLICHLSKMAQTASWIKHKDMQWQSMTRKHHSLYLSCCPREFVRSISWVTARHSKLLGWGQGLQITRTKCSSLWLYASKDTGISQRLAANNTK